MKIPLLPTSSHQGRRIFELSFLFLPPWVGEDKGEGDFPGNFPVKFANLKIRSLTDFFERRRPF
jgi:hypothetical protein